VHSPNPELRCELLSSRHRGPVGAGGRSPPRTFSERRRRGAGVGLLLTLRTRGSQIPEEPQTDWPELVHKLPLSRALICRLRAATSACSMTHLGSDLPLLGIASRPPTIREESRCASCWPSWRVQRHEYPNALRFGPTRLVWSKRRVEL
jgi:hypothetical protein